MRNLLGVLAVCTLWFSTAVAAQAQEPTNENAVDEQPQQIATDAREKVDEVAKKVNESEQAQEVSAGILKHIYNLAEYFSFSAFHWLAFALMVAGVVSFALQLVLAKLILLAKMSFSLMEILSDALGLVISLVGLVLTTQAATENSNFTQSPAAVLSATVVGAVAGFIFYLWGQSQELRAHEGRMKQRSSEK
jgi:uncharacterized membrane protein